MNTSSWQTRRVWIGGCALLALLVVAAAWFLAIDPKRSDTSDTKSQTTSVQAQNDLLAAGNASLAAEKAKLPALQAKLATALETLPSDSQLPQFTVSVTQMAARARVNLTNISIGAPAPAEPVAAAPTSGADSTSASTSSPSPTAASPSGTVSTTAAPGEYSIPITVQATGSPTALAYFVHELEFSARAATVTSSQLSAGDHSTNLSAQLNVFTAPLTSAQIKELKHLLAAGS